jgi:hypothetical protein
MNGKAISGLRVGLAIFIAANACGSLAAKGLPARTDQAFEQYVRASEARELEEWAGKATFLWIDGLAGRDREQKYQSLRSGQVIVQRHTGCRPAGCAEIPDGLIHDWTGVVFVPGVSLRQTVEALQDYDHDSEYYRPEVVRSKLLSRTGDRFGVFLRLQRKRVITVVLDTEYSIEYRLLDATHAISRSRSLRITEVEGAGTTHEHTIADENGHGYLWRLNSYWRFYQGDGGVYIQCNAISLTRDIPMGLGWVVGSYIERIPRESLQFTLNATRNALLEKFHNTRNASKTAGTTESPAQ